MARFVAKILSPQHVALCDPFCYGAKHPLAKPTDEPRWSKALSHAFAALSPEEWLRLERIQRRDEQELVEIMRTRETPCPPEMFDARERLRRRSLDVFALLILFRRYVRFDADSTGIQDYAALQRRLEPFGEFETPSLQERNERDPYFKQNTPSAVPQIGVGKVTHPDLRRRKAQQQQA